MVRPSPSHTAPAFATPMAAQLVAELPEGDDWTYEAKLDGYRALLIRNGAKVELRSRNNKDLTRMYPRIAAMGAHLEAQQVVLDGEIVALDWRAGQLSKRFSIAAPTRITRSSSTHSTCCTLMAKTGLRSPCRPVAQDWR